MIRMPHDTTATMQAFGVGAIVYALMITEALRSRRNERALRARGAIEPRDDVYPLMQIAYPVAFAAPLIEGWWRGSDATAWLVAGAIVFTAAKALKYWAVASLGPLWSFRVLVLPGVPLVSAGPYRLMRHPNYAGVIGEILGVALMMTAPITGLAALATFAALLRKRVQVEERALAFRGERREG
jgi:methyltransferase